MKKRLISFALVLSFMLVGVIVVSAASQNLISTEVNVSSTNTYSKKVSSSYAYATTMITMEASNNTSTKTFIKISQQEANGFAKRIEKVGSFYGDGSVVVANGYVGTGTWKYELYGKNLNTGAKYDPWTGYVILSSSTSL